MKCTMPIRLVLEKAETNVLRSGDIFDATITMDVDDVEALAVAIVHGSEPPVFTMLADA